MKFIGEFSEIFMRRESWLIDFSPFGKVVVYRHFPNDGKNPILNIPNKSSGDRLVDVGKYVQTANPTKFLTHYETKYYCYLVNGHNIKRLMTFVNVHEMIFAKQFANIHSKYQIPEMMEVEIVADEKNHKHYGFSSEYYPTSWEVIE